MTEDFKKGVAVGLAVGGVTVTKSDGDGMKALYVIPIKAIIGGILTSYKEAKQGRDTDGRMESTCV